MSTHNMRASGTLSSSHEFEEPLDLLEGLQNIPSHFDLALNNRPTAKYLLPKPKHDEELQDPEHFRRLSVSTLSSTGRFSRDASPFPGRVGNASSSWRARLFVFWERNQGLFLVTFSQLFGALMNVTTRLLELEGDGMEPFQILFARQSLTVVLCSIWMWWKKVPDFPLGAKDVRLLLVARSISGFFGIYGMYYSLQYLELRDATVIPFLAPSVAGYACYLFLHEPFPRSSQYASLVSLLGVILIARPTSFFSSSGEASPTPTPPSANTTTPESYPSFTEATPMQRLDAVLVALLGVLGSAGAFTSIRHIGSRAHPLISVNYFSVFCTIISFLALTVPSPLDLSFKLPANLRQWGMLLFLGLCGFTMQFLLTKGLSSGGKKEGGRGMHMIYTNMLFAMGLDRWVFGVVPGMWSLIGGGIVLGGAVWVAVQKKEAVSQGGRSDDMESGVPLRNRERNREFGNEEERTGMLGPHVSDDESRSHVVEESRR